MCPQACEADPPPADDPQPRIEAVIRLIPSGPQPAHHPTLGTGLESRQPRNYPAGTVRIRARTPSLRGIRVRGLLVEEGTATGSAHRAVSTELQDRSCRAVRGGTVSSLSRYI